jgi:inhibitor of KinA
MPKPVRRQERQGARVAEPLGAQQPVRFAPLGDRAITITLGDAIDEATNRRVRAISALLDARALPCIVDQVPAFASLTLHYDPALVVGDDSDDSPYERFVNTLEPMLAKIREDETPAPRIVEIPVCYGGDLGPDLQDVARQHGMEVDEVVRVHSSCDYVVYMIGFMPGFAYLGGLAPELATPRRSSPRTAVPAGTVGIGGQQTGVYPLVSPGGWNLIGRTPLQIFDPSREDASLLDTGDRVRFIPISRTDFDGWPST